MLSTKLPLNTLSGEVHNASPQIKNTATLSMDAGRELFALAGIQSIHSETQSPNVISVLEARS